MQRLNSILIVEPDAVEIGNIKRLLSGLDCDVTSVERIDDAHKLLLGSSMRTKRSGRPGLILLRNEPDQNGLRLVEQLRDSELTAGIPVILMTDSIINPQVWDRFSPRLYAQIATPVTYVKLHFALAGLDIRSSGPGLFILPKTSPEEVPAVEESV